jgi:hypothetical protein
MPPETSTKRRATTARGPSLGGMPCRAADVEPTKALRAIAILMRVMAALLVLVMVLQVVNAVSGAIEIASGVLFAEAIRLVIGAGLLWGLASLAELQVTSHRDVRATRILLERILARDRDAGIPARGATGDLEPIGEV